MARFLVTHNDEQGKPRAWATSDDLQEAHREAMKQLEEYRAKKRVLGDLLADHEYTCISYKEKQGGGWEELQHDK